MSVNENITARRPKYKTPRVEYLHMTGNDYKGTGVVDLTHAVTNITFSSSIKKGHCCPYVYEWVRD